MNGRKTLVIAAACFASCFVLPATAFGQAILLSGWDNLNEIGANTATHGPLRSGANTNAFQPNGQGTTPINGDGFPLPVNLNGRWYVKDANGSSPEIGSDVRLSQSTTVGVVPTDPDFPGSTGAIKITQGGSSRGGGDTHFNFAAAGIFLYEPFPGPDAPFFGQAASEPVPVLLDDPRGDALVAARNDPANYRFEFDATWDVENIIVRDPSTGEIQNNWFGIPEVTLGFYMSNGTVPGGNNWISLDVLNPTSTSCIDCSILFSGDQRFDLSAADPSDAPGSIPVAPITRHVSLGMPPADWPGTGVLYQPRLETLAGQTGYMYSLAVGFTINGNWANGPVDDPASSQSVYVDNLKLVRFPLDPTQRSIDFNNDGIANVADWEIFVANHLLPSSTYPAGADNPADLTCGTCWWDKGDVDHDGDNDFQDYLSFVQLYNLFNLSGSGGSVFDGMAAGFASLPEPASVWIQLIGMLLTTSILRQRKF